MANQIQVFNPSANMPAHAKAAPLDSVALALAGSGSTGKRISIKGGVFRLFSGGKEVTAIDDRYLDVVVIAAAPKVSRTFYGTKYIEGQATAPTCWSSNGDTPDAMVTAKCATTCMSCPNNVKGSGKDDSKACTYNQHIAVVLANDLEGDVLKLTLPAQSIFGKGEGDNRPLQEYARFYAAQGISVSKFITRLKFDTSAAVPKLFFKAMRWLDDEEYAITTAQGATSEAIAAITLTVSQADGVPPGTTVATAAPLTLPGKEPKAAKAAKAAPEPEPEPEEDDEPPPPPKKAKAAKAAPKEYAAASGEATPEPEVKKSAKSAPAAVGGGLNDVLAAWDDE